MLCYYSMDWWDDIDPEDYIAGPELGQNAQNPWHLLGKKHVLPTLDEINSLTALNWRNWHVTPLRTEAVVEVYTGHSYPEDLAEYEHPSLRRLCAPWLTPGDGPPCNVETPCVAIPKLRKPTPPKVLRKRGRPRKLPVKLKRPVGEYQRERRRAAIAKLEVEMAALTEGTAGN